MFKGFLVLMATTHLGVWAAMPPPAAMSNAAISIERRVFGSGTPGASGEEVAMPVGDTGSWHAPQYLPGYPRAGTIWPRAVFVRCKNQHCEGYLLTPEMGPGEYLFFVPIEDSKEAP